MKFLIKDFFSKCHQIRRKLRVWSYLLKKSLMENFIFCAVFSAYFTFTFLDRVRIRGLEMLIFRKILRTYLIDGLLQKQNFYA